jgi:hypothetical protein
MPLNVGDPEPAACFPRTQVLQPPKLPRRARDSLHTGSGDASATALHASTAGGGTASLPGGLARRHSVAEASAWCAAGTAARDAAAGEAAGGLAHGRSAITVSGSGAPPSAESPASPLRAAWLPGAAPLGREASAAELAKAGPEAYARAAGAAASEAVLAALQPLNMRPAVATSVSQVVIPASAQPLTAPAVVPGAQPMAVSQMRRLKAQASAQLHVAAGAQSLVSREEEPHTYAELRARMLRSGSLVGRASDRDVAAELDDATEETVGAAAAAPAMQPAAWQEAESAPLSPRVSAPLPPRPPAPKPPALQPALSMPTALAPPAELPSAAASSRSRKALGGVLSGARCRQTTPLVLAAPSMRVAEPEPPSPTPLGSASQEGMAFVAAADAAARRAARRVQLRGATVGAAEDVQPQGKASEATPLPSPRIAAAPSTATSEVRDGTEEAGAQEAPTEGARLTDARAQLEGDEAGNEPQLVLAPTAAPMEPLEQEFSNNRTGLDRTGLPEEHDDQMRDSAAMQLAAHVSPPLVRFASSVRSAIGSAGWSEPRAAPQPAEQPVEPSEEEEVDVADQADEPDAVLAATLRRRRALVSQRSRINY